MSTTKMNFFGVLLLSSWSIVFGAKNMDDMIQIIEYPLLNTDTCFAGLEPEACGRVRTSEGVPCVHCEFYADPEVDTPTFAACVDIMQADQAVSTFQQATRCKFPASRGSVTVDETERVPSDTGVVDYVTTTDQDDVVKLTNCIGSGSGSNFNVCGNTPEAPLSSQNCIPCDVSTPNGDSFLCVTARAAQSTFSKFMTCGPFPLVMPLPSHIDRIDMILDEDNLDLNCLEKSGLDSYDCDLSQCTWCPVKDGLHGLCLTSQQAQEAEHSIEWIDCP